MANPTLIPQAYPLDIGQSDQNGDRARYQPVAGMERALQHLNFARRGAVAGWSGKRTITTGDDVYFRSTYRREQYTDQVVLRVWYSTSTPLVTSALRFGTEEESSPTISLQRSLGATAEEAIVYQTTVDGGTLASGDAGRSDLFVRFLSVASDDPSDSAPELYIWSIKWYIQPLSYLELT